MSVSIPEKLATNKKNILVVDNHPLMLKFMLTILEKEQHNVTTAIDGFEALEKLKSFVPDIIFTDLVMPNIGGKRLCRIIRNIPELEKIFIIILSAAALEVAPYKDDFLVDSIIAKGPLMAMKKHVLNAIIQSENKSDQRNFTQTRGFENICERTITKELLSAQSHSEFLLEHIEEAILEISENGKIINVNAAAMKLVNVPVEHLLSSDFLSIFRTSHQKDVKNMLDSVSAVGPTSIHTPLVLYNGKKASIKVLPSKKLNQNVATVILNDVSEQINLEKAIQRQNDYLSALHETSLGMIDRLDKNELLKTIVRRIALLAGTEHGFVYLLTPEETHMEMKVGRGLFNELIGYRIKSGQNLVGKVWETKRPLVINDYPSWNYGQANEVFRKLESMVGIPIYSGSTIVGVIGLGYTEKDSVFHPEDIEILNRFAELASIALDNSRLYEDTCIELTERKKSEKALRYSEEKYRLLVENANESIFIAQDGAIKFPNPKTIEITGYSLKELTNMPFSDIIHPDDRQMVIDRHIKRLQGEDIPGTYSFRIITKQGQLFWIQLSAVLITWEGNPATLNFARDITLQKKIETQLLESQKMQAIGTLAGGIAHDFNNLLMGIQGNASISRMNTDRNHPNYKKLMNIESYVETGAELTKQLLGFARAGKYLVEPTDLNSLIKKQNLMFGRTRKEISIIEDLENELWVVEIDQGQIEQILLNVYINAWEAMPKGGNLYVKTENVTLSENDADPAQIKSGPYIKVSVTDTGIGMDEVLVKRIFDPFFTTKEITRGTGLGLASAYGIIKNHGGFINVDSKLGKGTTIGIFLPALLENKSQIDGKGTQTDTDAKRTILLIDDEEMILDVGKELLEELGYKVVTAANGEEGIKIYQKMHHEIGIVILDMIMPDMNGSDTFDHLIKINPKAKVLLSSGYSTSEPAVKILKRGCSGFIQKPYTLALLSKKIEAVFQDNTCNTPWP